jgi:hypothetical protein
MAMSCAKAVRAVSEKDCSVLRPWVFEDGDSAAESARFVGW